MGGAGLGLALDVLQKKEHPHLVKITPVLWDSEANAADLKKAYNDKLDPFYSVAISIPPYTHFTADQLIERLKEELVKRFDIEPFSPSRLPEILQRPHRKASDLI